MDFQFCNPMLFSAFRILIILFGVVLGAASCEQPPSKYAALMRQPEYRSERWQHVPADGTPQRMLYKTHLQFEMIYALADDVITGAMEEETALHFLKEFDRVVSKDLVGWREEQKRGIDNLAIQHFVKCLEAYLSATSYLRQAVTSEESEDQRWKLMVQARLKERIARSEAEIVGQLLEQDQGRQAPIL